MVVKVKRLRRGSPLPTKATDGSAGFDLYANLGGYDVCVIEPHCTYKVNTGIAVAIPKGYFGAVFARSGIATKQGLRPANCVGVIDSDYRGEIIVPLHNDTDDTQSISNGDRVAQLVILPCPEIELKQVRSLDETERGAGGFGSSGSGGTSSYSPLDGQITLEDLLYIRGK